MRKYIVNDSKNKKYLPSLKKRQIRKKLLIFILNFENRFLLKAIVSFFVFLWCKKLSVGNSSFFKGLGAEPPWLKAKPCTCKSIPGYFRTDTYPDVLLPDG